MADLTPSKIKSEREKWHKILSSLVENLLTQQQQLQSLSDEKTRLQDLYKATHDQWVSDVQNLEFELEREKNKASLLEMGQYLEIGRSQLMKSLNNSKSLISDLKLEFAEDDWEHFRSCYDHVSPKLLEYEVSGNKNEKGGEGKHGKSLETTVGGSGSHEEEQHSINVEDVGKLKLEYDTLLLNKKNEVSALISEKNFVWNQFTDMEKECANLRRSKEAELKQANEQIYNFLTSMERLQSLNSDKDETIMKLKDELAKLEADKENESKENSSLRKELETLKNMRAAPQTPIPNSCTTRGRAANMDRQRNSRDRRLALKQESPFSQSSGVGSKGLKRNEVEAIPVSSTPKLFSSRFKVPKLKSPSPCTTAI